ncbi:hypothetical protein SEPCBS119000_002363 [Sporothrix epigloea]|uniref:NDT80 domain-containing protein n=1 Tax=Sporothrix epigloea TaxID=1892477 RepID=A0ABP0DFT6_9PEZI
MAELKEPAQGLWTGYGSPAPMSNAAGAAPSASSTHSARPKTDATGYSYTPRYVQDDTDVYDRHHSTSAAAGMPDPSVASHTSYPSLKRTYSQSEQQHQQQPPPQPRMPLYGNTVSDLRKESGVKIHADQEHKLLSFKRIQDKYTIVDRQGHIQQLDLSAQLHGMFFLSELPIRSSDGSGLKPELTCYRRNLFQVSGRLITPRGQLSIVGESGHTTAIKSTELTISATESVDLHPIRLIVIPWKTPPPNSPDIAISPDQEPVPLPLIPFQDDGSKVDGDYAVYPIGWRRLQFRIATANNGRRRELQQHFMLHLKAIATLANGTKAVLAEAITAQIVVRGRSPRNFEARKEISLLGSSAGSRGQALVETGMGIVAGPLTAETQEKAREMAMELPRSSFNFTGDSVPHSPVSLRSNAYPEWRAPHMLPPTPAGAEYPAASMPSEPYQKSPSAGSPHYTVEPQDVPAQHNPTLPSSHLPLVDGDHSQSNPRTQYAYTQGTSAPSPQTSLPTPGDAGSLSIPRYVDSSDRPTKSARLANQDSIHSATPPGTSNDAPSEYRYGPSSYLSAVTAGEMGPPSLPHPQPQLQSHPHPPPHQLPHPYPQQSQQYSTQHSPTLPPTQQGRPQQHSQPPSQQHSPPQLLPLPSPPQHSQQHQLPSAYHIVSHDTSGPSSASNSSSVTPAVHPPSRDYYPPLGSWAPSPHDSHQSQYGSGEPRHYMFPDAYKAGHQSRSEVLPQPVGYAAPRSSFDPTTMNNYSWSAA